MENVQENNNNPIEQQETPQAVPEAEVGTNTIQAAEAFQAAQSMNYTHKFNPPVEILGKQYKSLSFYFEELTGEDVEAVELELQQRNIIVLSAEVSSAFQMGIAARAARMPADDLRRLPLRDYMRIKNAARDFLVTVGY